METTDTAPEKRPVRVIYGLITGLIMILFTTLLYLGGVKSFIGGVAYLGYIIMIGLAATAALVQKKANGGYLEFAEAVKICFTVFVIALIAQTLFTWLLLNVIDTHFKMVLKEAVIKKMQEVYTQFGISQDKIDKGIAEEQTIDHYSLKEMSMGFAFSCIVHFIIALVIAAIVKKKKTDLSTTAL
jgi:hypothetical protein